MTRDILFYILGGLWPRCGYSLFTTFCSVRSLNHWFSKWGLGDSQRSLTGNLGTVWPYFIIQLFEKLPVYKLTMRRTVRLWNIWNHFETKKYLLWWSIFSDRGPWTNACQFGVLHMKTFENHWSKRSSSVRNMPTSQTVCTAFQRLPVIIIAYQVQITTEQHCTARQRTGRCYHAQYYNIIIITCIFKFWDIK